MRCHIVVEYGALPWAHAVDILRVNFGELLDGPYRAVKRLEGWWGQWAPKLLRHCIFHLTYYRDQIGYQVGRLLSLLIVTK